MIGYVQGMNFIAASLLYHTSEVCAFWLLISMIDTYGMKEVFKQGLPGVGKHDHEIQALGRRVLPKIFDHFVSSHQHSDLLSCL